MPQTLVALCKNIQKRQALTKSLKEAGICPITTKYFYPKNSN